MEEAEEPDCPICHEPVTAPHVLDCAHTFCTGCIVSWFRCEQSNGKCPLCRESQPPTEGPLVGAISVADALQRTRVVIREARKKTATKDVRRAAERCRKARLAVEAASTEYREFRREHREILKQVQKLRTRKWRQRRREREVRRQVGFGVYETPLGEIPVVSDQSWTYGRYRIRRGI